MIRHWFGYWNRNKLVLMDGDFIPSDPVGNYPYLTAVADAKQITTLYEDVVVEVDAAARQIDVVNAKTSLDVVIKLNQSFDGLITISDCKGEVVFEQQMTLPVGVSLFNVPVSGTLSLQ
jgi:alpha-galactosidase